MFKRMIDTAVKKRDFAIRQMEVAQNEVDVAITKMMYYEKVRDECNEEIQSLLRARNRAVTQGDDHD